MTVLDSNSVERQTFPANEKEPSAFRLDSGGLYLEGRRIPLYSGSIHYWRYPPEIWPTLLERVKELGFNIVQTPVPWGIHESGPGNFDFGAKNPQNNLSRFLDLCMERGISILLQTGPCVDEDIPFGGFPQRIVKTPSLWALTSSGTPAVSFRTNPPFVIPSYASENLFLEVGKFFDWLAPVIKPRQSPKGPVIMCAVNRETAFYGRRGGYDLDYSTDSISLFHHFLTEKYSSVETLNGIYGTKYSAFSGIQPPRFFNAAGQRDVPSYLDWIEYKEYLIRHAIRRLSKMLQERGLNVPLVIDGPPDISTPIDIFELQAMPEVFLCGMEVDPSRQDYASLARSVRYLAGTRKLAWVSTFGCGTSWLSPRIPTPEEEEFAILAAIMHGMSAVNFHMLVERDRWVGAPITREGAYREEYADLFRRLKDFITQNQVWDRKKAVRVLVLLPFSLERYHRFFSTTDQAYLGLLRVPAAFSEVQSSLGFQTEPAHQSVLEENNWISEIFQFLEQAQVEYNISDTHAPLDELNKYGMIFLPTADFMDTKEQEKLLAFVDHGGHLVIGPGLPTQDGSMLPVSVLANHIQAPGSQSYGAGKIILLSKLDAESVKSILRPEMENSIVTDNPNLRLTIREGNATLVFLANPTGDAQKTRMVSSRPLQGLWNVPGDIRKSPVTTELKPFTIQVWEVI
jgi:beta-galactosidase